MKRLLLSSTALILAAPALAQVSPAQMGITPTTVPEVLQVLDKNNHWVAIGQVDPNAHVFMSLGAAVANNTQLSALSKSMGEVTRLGYAVEGDTPPIEYKASNAPCSLNAGAGDGGSQVPTSDGACWVWVPPSAGVSPTAFGAIGDGVTNDLNALQAAINGTSTAQVPLIWDLTHLYYAPGTLNVTNPFVFRGPMGLGVWTTTPTETDNGYCHWGVKAVQTGGAAQTLFNISALSGTFGPLCIQMAGDPASNATAGAAINVAPPNTTSYITGLTIDRPYIYNGYDGIDLNGAGSSTACCGIGAAANPIIIHTPTIISAVHEGIALGANTMYAATVGISVYDANVVCRNSASQANGKAVVVHDGAIWLGDTTNGPLGCAYGVVVNPGLNQNAQAIVTGVICDQCTTHSLLIQPTDPSAVISYSTFSDCWATPNAATTTPVLISNANGGIISGVKFVGCDIHSWPNQSVPLVDVEGTATATGAQLAMLTFTGTHFTLWGGGTRSSRGRTIFPVPRLAPGQLAFTGPIVLINATASNLSRDILFTGSYFGMDFTEYGTVTNATGIKVTYSGAGIPAYVGINGNDFTDVGLPVDYTPPNGNARFQVGQNVGISDVSRVINTPSGTVNLTASDQNIVFSGGGSVLTLNYPWQERPVTLLASNGAVTLGGTGTNFCASTTIATGKMIRAQWDVNEGCWATSN